MEWRLRYRNNAERSISNANVPRNNNSTHALPCAKRRRRHSGRTSWSGPKARTCCAVLGDTSAADVDWDCRRTGNAFAQGEYSIQSVSRVGVLPKIVGKLMDVPKILSSRRTADPGKAASEQIALDGTILP